VKGVQEGRRKLSKDQESSVWYSLVEQLREGEGCEEWVLARAALRQRRDVLEESRGPEILARVRELVWRIASREYPLVWVGKPGMTEEDLSEFRKMNEELPEYMRAEPGEFVGIEGSGEGFQIPEVGGPRLNGLDVIAHLSGEMQEEAEARLHHEVMHVYAAKQGKVVIELADEIEWVPKERLTGEDTAWLVGVPGFAMGHGLQARQDAIVKDLPPVVGVWIGMRTKAMPVDELTPEQMDEDFFEDLEHHAAGGTVGPFMIPETPRVKAYLAEHGEYPG
jgi:hypothetical protein